MKHGVIAWFASNSVAANLLMFAIIAGGLLTIPGLKQEVFPELEMEMISITVPYPGASPEEVEQAVTVRVEEAVQGLEGVKRITSTSLEGRSGVTVELLLGVDVNEALDDVKSRVDAITTFPEEVEEPVIQDVVQKRQVLNVAISGDTDEHSLKRLGERVRDELSALPGITQVELAAARPYEIHIEVSEQALRRHDLTFDEVARAIRRGSVDLPGGEIKTGAGEVLVRTLGQAETGEQFARIPLRTRMDGSRLLVGDVATVVDGFADTDQASRFNGEPVVLAQVFRVGEQGALDIAREVHAWVEDARTRMPEGIHLTVWQDESRTLQGRLDLMLRNARMGFVLVFLLLALFLRLRLAFWASLGIPISFLGAVLLMPALGVSINVISLFAFIVALGIVVDDAIIVGENVFRHYEKHGEPMRAAVEGTREVLVPVTFAILTSIAAFLPLLMVPGTTGKIMRVIPLVVISALVFSWIESKLVLPAHLAHGTGKRREGPGNLWHRFQGRFYHGLRWFVDNVYRRHLEVALRWRHAVMAGFTALLLVTFGMVGAGHIQFIFFPPVEGDNVVALVSMPQGTPAEVTGRAVERLEASAARVRERLDAEHTAADGGSLFRQILASIGEQPYAVAQDRNAGMGGAATSAPHLGEVNIQLAPSELRDVSSDEVANLWRQETGAIPDAEEVRITSSLFSTGDDVDVQLTGPDLDSLRSAAAALRRALTDYAGVSDISDSFRAGKQEARVSIRPEGEAAGLTQDDLSRQLRQAFHGEEAQRIQRGRDDVKVMVRYPESDRGSLADLEDMRVRLPTGQGVPFHRAATFDLERGWASVRRVDRQRAINVTADVDDSVTSARKVLDDLARDVLPGIMREHPGVRWSFEGQRREQRDTLGGLARGFVFAMLAIYTLLAIPFRSYLQPLIVMSAIPFGLIGAVWGHVLLGLPLTILSMFGVVALTGVVVNDSLVLVDFINRHRRDTGGILQAVRDAGAQRFRPIILTSLTTFAGLTPLLLEKSVQAQFLIPMAVSLAFGVLFATLITLMLVPCLYVILEDVRGVGRAVIGLYRDDGDDRGEAGADGPGGTDSGSEGTPPEETPVATR